MWQVVWLELLLLNWQNPWSKSNLTLFFMHFRLWFVSILFRAFWFFLQFVKFSIYILFFFLFLSFYWFWFFCQHLSIFFVKSPGEFLFFPKTGSFQTGRTDYVVKAVAYEVFLTGRLWTTNSVFQMAVGVSALFLLGVCFSTLFLFCFCFPLHFCLVFLTTLYNYAPFPSCGVLCLLHSVGFIPAGSVKSQVCLLFFMLSLFTI